MRVIVKYPGKEPEVMEAEGIRDINKLVGNVDEQGNGWDHTSSDIRSFIADGIDEYVKANAAYNPELEPNLWSSDDFNVWCGTVVYTGYDSEKPTDCGACSLTDEQIEFCLSYIERQKA